MHQSSAAFSCRNRRGLRIYHYNSLKKQDIMRWLLKQT